MRCVTSNTPFDFGADEDRDPDRDFSNGIFFHCGVARRNCGNFAGSAFRGVGLRLLSASSFISLNQFSVTVRS